MRKSLVMVAALLVAGEGVTAAAQVPSAGQDGRPEPLILQETDGEPLVRRSGPTGGWPYLIKLDPRQGGTEDFFVMAEVIAPGQVIPFHMHDNAEEILLFMQEELTKLRTQGHATYWDTSKGPSPPGVPLP
jgi:hypothetical protein